jgi:hypothetical protein
MKNTKKNRATRINVSSKRKEIFRKFHPTENFFALLVKKEILKRNSLIKIRIGENFYDMIVEKVDIGTLPNLFARVVNRNRYSVGERIFRVPCEKIVRIDDMELSRIARSLEVDENGEMKEVKIDAKTGLPIRRGRKSKKVLELLRNLEKKENGK